MEASSICESIERRVEASGRQQLSNIPRMILQTCRVYKQLSITSAVKDNQGDATLVEI